MKFTKGFLLTGLAAMLLTVTTAGSCGGGDDDESSNSGSNSGGNTNTAKDSWANLVNENAQTFKLEGNTLTYGSHVYTVSGSINTEGTDKNEDGVADEKLDVPQLTPTAFVTFTNIPSGYKEFETVYKELLGKSLQGTAAMIPMAMEIYGRDRETGLKCIKLLCVENNVNSMVSILKDKFGEPSPYAGPNDTYMQRYLPAATLKGALPTNAYKANEPYTVEMLASVNLPQRLNFSATPGLVTYLYVLGGGWDTTQRSAEIFLADGQELYKVFNCPAFYTQCKNCIGTWAGLK